jgi:uncharacterized protein (DUF2147 family)
MSKSTLLLPGILAACLLLLPQSRAEAPTPVGMWVTVDEKTGKETALVEISLRDAELTGTVRQIFPQPGEDTDPRCEQCAGARKNQPVKGMQIIWGMSKTDEGYGGGQILDPDEGTIYRCKLKLSADGRQLLVHGYVGIPILGRTQVWLRQSDRPFTPPR